MIIRDTTIDESTLVVITTCLTVLIEEAQASTALLIGEDGYIYARVGSSELTDPIGLATLIAASFGAAKETAKVAGETNFESTFWKGEKNGIFVVKLTTDHLLVAIFNEATTLGMVKMYSEKIALQIGEIITERSQQADADIDPQKGKWKDIVDAIRGGGDEPLDL